MQVIVDSGSATLAVAANGCNTCAQEGVQTFYDLSHGTWTGMGARGAYGYGSWIGEAYEDDVGAGGSTSVQMDLAAIIRDDGMFGYHICDVAANVPFEGILGLGPDALRDRRTDSYLSRVVEQQFLPDGFGLRFCHSGGTLWLGGYDEAAAIGPMTFVTLHEEPYYEVDVSTVEVRPQVNEATVVRVSNAADHLPAMLDSGGPHLFLPDEAYHAVISAITADPAFAELGDSAWWSDGITVLQTNPQAIDASLPRLVFNFADDADLQVSLPATESYLSYVTRRYDGTYEYQPNLFSDSTQPASDANLIDLGNLPMYSYVVYTDRENHRLGFAPAIPCDGE